MEVALLSLPRMLLVTVLIALVAASCGPLADVVTSSSGTTTASLRVLHGSPDAGSLDVKIDSVSTGTSLLSSAAYGAVGAYVSVNTGAHYVEIIPGGGSTASLTCTSPSLVAGTKYTVVVAGTAAKGYGTTLGVQCQTFTEPTFSTPSGDYTLAVHHASPALAAAGFGVLSFGTYAPGTQSYQAPVGTAAFTPLSSNATASGSVTTDVAVGVTTAPGVGFWFAPQTSAAPATAVTTIRPSQGVAGAAGVAGSGDTGDLLPSGSLINFSVYVIDAQGGGLAQAVGAFD